ncbi:ty3-gypsy retrotransposon protein [Cucumis melo var. makuwa]|uniref:Ty3-gypsy retrotransposon protein n=1 Tax=Cucumis melo var. makuwa TaxID=1194695 RepID=A0A5A7UVT6_CUCMM|nr:ty3-gypsy retrotransposon protein [Cucumis melo var. makuwa]TYK27470.1 ty3-gypsy retrotransposon protein [Cucumis melo var. makuwa]
MLFILSEEESIEEEGTSKGNIDEIMELEHLDIVEVSEIELKTITDFSSKGTMKLKGMLKDKEVVVLINSGVTHNFIHQALWLDYTGTMKVHWSSLTMTFWVGKKQIIMRGDLTLIKAECSLKTLEKTWDEEAQGFLLELQYYEIEVEDDYGEELWIKGDEEDLIVIKSLLNQNSDIF